MGVGHSRDGGSEDGDSGGLSLPWNPLQMYVSMLDNSTAVNIESVRLQMPVPFVDQCLQIDMTPRICSSVQVKYSYVNHA